MILTINHCKNQPHSTQEKEISQTMSKEKKKEKTIRNCYLPGKSLEMSPSSAVTQSICFSMLHSGQSNGNVNTHKLFVLIDTSAKILLNRKRHWNEHEIPSFFVLFLEVFDVYWFQLRTLVTLILQEKPKSLASCASHLLDSNVVYSTSKFKVKRIEKLITN